jgi:methylenetetrahydrofolate dehydrogenase (NADP+) / methenyltetrahydrofolate cyclohydrolase
MKAVVVSGGKVSEKILLKTRAFLKKHGLKALLAVILVGSDKASLSYVSKKKEAAEKVGIGFRLFHFDKGISNERLVREIQKIQRHKGISGVIVQLPLPKGLDKKLVLNQLQPDLDVDYLSWESLGKLVIGDNPIVPAAPGAILEILKHYRVDLVGKHIVLVGQGDLIGKPLTNLLIQKPVTLTACNKHTKGLSKITRQADILISGAGIAGLIKGNMVKKGAIVMDAGISFVNGKIKGDVSFKGVSKVASLITPTPGGVGPVTVAKLLENTAVLALKHKNKTNA